MQHSFLLKELVRRDLQSRYRGSLFGFLWAFVHPLWQLVLLWVVFSVILKVPLTGERTASFPVFLFSGLVPWLGFAEGIQRAATAVVEHSGLVRKLRFPSELLVVSSIASALIHQFVALAIFAVWQAVAGEPAWGRLPWLFFGLAAQVALALGLGWAASALQVFFRDVAQGLGIALQAWFYLTPIVYPLSLIPAGLGAVSPAALGLCGRALGDCSMLPPHRRAVPAGGGRSAISTGGGAIAKLGARAAW